MNRVAAILNKRGRCPAVFPVLPPVTDTPRSRSRKSQRFGSDDIAPDRGCPVRSATDRNTARSAPGSGRLSARARTRLARACSRRVAIGIVDQVGHVRVIVVAKRLQLLDSGGIVVAVVDRCIGCAVTLTKCRVVDAGMLAGLLDLLGGFSARPLRVRRRRVRRRRIRRAKADRLFDVSVFVRREARKALTDGSVSQSPS